MHCRWQFLLDQLGVGGGVRRRAGPQLTRVGWVDADASIMADMPRCSSGSDGYGRALGRDVLDSLLLQRAKGVGVEVLQPARVDPRKAGIPLRHREYARHARHPRRSRPFLHRLRDHSDRSPGVPGSTGLDSTLALPSSTQPWHPGGEMTCLHSKPVSLEPACRPVICRSSPWSAAMAAWSSPTMDVRLWRYACAATRLKQFARVTTACRPVGG